MTTSLPVVLDGSPADCPHPRVSVIRRRGTVNAGDGPGSTFAVRHVVDGRQRICLGASSAAVAAERAAKLVRARRPRAVWLRDELTARGVFYAATEPWQPLARAASEAQAAFVAWTGREA